MGVVSVVVPPIGFPAAPAASKLIDLTDVEAGAVGSAVGMFLTEIAPVAGSRRFGFMPAAGGLKVADWDVTGEPMPLDPVAVGGELATVGGVATVSVLNPVPVMGGAAIFYGLTMPVGLPLESATLDLIWPVLPTDAPAYVLTLLHDQTADLTALVESVLGVGAAGVAGLVAGLQFGEGFGLTFPSGDSLPLALPESSQSIVLTVNSSGSLVFSGFGGDVLTAAAAAGSYAISYLMLVMGVSESLPPLSIDFSASTLGGGNGAAELPVDVSDLDTIYRVTSAGMYAGQALKQGDHVIFYNDQADFLIIRLPADFDPDAVADLVAAAIAESLQAGGAIDTAIDEKLQQAAQSGGAVDTAIDAKLVPLSKSAYISARFFYAYSGVADFVPRHGIFFLTKFFGLGGGEFISIDGSYFAEGQFVYFDPALPSGARAQAVEISKDSEITVMGESGFAVKMVYNQDSQKWQDKSLFMVLVPDENGAPDYPVYVLGGFDKVGVSDVRVRKIVIDDQSLNLTPYSLYSDERDLVITADTAERTFSIELPPPPLYVKTYFKGSGFTKNSESVFLLSVPANTLAVLKYSSRVFANDTSGAISHRTISCDFFNE